MDYLRSNLKALIEKANTNPTQLSRATGVPQPTIKRILDGTSAEARSRTIAPIAAHFNISVEDLKNVDLAAEASGSEPFVVRELIEPEATARARRITERFDAIRYIKQAEHLFTRSIDKEFTKNLNSIFSVNGLHFDFTYCSDKIAAEFRVHQSRFSRLSQHSTQNPSTAYLSLWRLSTLRLSTLDSHPDRKYFLFINIFNPDGVAVPMGNISRMIAEAGLHKINVVLSGPEEAAMFVNSFEKGTIRSFNEEGEEEEGNSSFL